VDLRDAANKDKSRDSRFLKKILTDAEIDDVKHAENSDQLLWSLWACKETAYKVIKKISPETVFVPRRWPTVFKKITSEYAEGEVGIWGEGGVFVRLFSRSDHVHCVGSDDQSILDQLIWNTHPLPVKEKIPPSLFVRRCIGQNLAEYFRRDFDAVEIRRERWKNELKPPGVYLDGQKTNIDVSLSHDGRFVAYAFHEVADHPGSPQRHPGRGWNDPVFQACRDF
jgi:phosphopantetheinyl transferase (holo-ACP synthase)